MWSVFTQAKKDVVMRFPIATSYMSKGCKLLGHYIHFLQRAFSK